MKPLLLILLLSACNAPKSAEPVSVTFDGLACISWPGEDTRNEACTPERAKRDAERLEKERQSNPPCAPDSQPNARDCEAGR